MNSKLALVEIFVWWGDILYIMFTGTLTSHHIFTFSSLLAGTVADTVPGSVSGTVPGMNFRWWGELFVVCWYSFWYGY